MERLKTQREKAVDSLRASFVVKPAPEKRSIRENSRSTLFDTQLSLFNIRCWVAALPR